jgi:hypothetical protein
VRDNARHLSHHERGAIVTDGKRRTLGEWLAEKQMTAEGLVNAGAGVSEDVILRWVKTCKMPPKVEASGRSLTIADALGVPPELLDVGPRYRGMTEAGYRFFLRTRGSDDHGWEAQIDAWGPPKDEPGGSTPRPIAERANSSSRTSGPTLEVSLDALEQELREVIRTNPRVENEAGEPP